MLEILQKIIALLKGDSTIIGLVPTKNILTGPVDLLSEKNTDLGLVLPAIILSVVSEAQRPVPTNTRDTQVQLDVYSRVSMLEVVTIYEQVVAVLSQQTYNQGSAHIFWQLLSGANDAFESDRRIWHRTATFQVWSVK